MRLYLSVTSTDGQTNTQKAIELSHDYNFDQIAEIVREMADLVAPQSKEEKDEKEGEARMEEGRGN